MQSDDITTRKIYIQSKERATGSVSNWVTELPYSVPLPANACCWVTDLSLPHSWLTVDAQGDKVWLMERYETSGGTQIRRFTTVTLPHRNYNAFEMAVELKLVLDAGTQIPATTVYTVVYQSETNNFLISLTSTETDPGFRFVPDAVLKSLAFRTAVGGTYSLSAPSSVNEVLGIADYDGAAAALLNEWNNVGPMLTSFTTGFCDMRRVHSLFLHSTALGTFKTIGPNATSTVIRRIPVTSSYSEILYSEGASHHLDFLEPPRDIRTLDFQIRDGRGRDVDMQNAAAGISFSLIFAEKPL